MNKTELVAAIAEQAEISKKDGEAMTIAASKTPKFKAGKALKDSIN